MTDHTRFFTILDRRDSTGRNEDNRQRFLKRYKASLRTAVKQALVSGSLKDLSASGIKNVRIKNEGTHEPCFHYSGEGVYHRLIVGNERFVVGDRIAKPEQDATSSGSSDGSGEDAFDFNIPLTSEEYQDLLFEDLELPNLVKQTLTASEEKVRVRDGFTKSGPPANLDHKRTIFKAHMRKRVFRASADRHLKPILQRMEELEALLADTKEPGLQTEYELLKQRAHQLQVRKNAIPHFAKNDTQYRHWNQEPLPITKAVMFHLMDVSGSMGEWEKEMAKRFYLLLRIFLLRQYDHVEPVYITYHTDAAEVSEEEFFYGKETGGTVVSNGLALVQSVLQARFPLNEWNVYICHSSDGDNLAMDNEAAAEILATLMPATQYYAYVEIMSKWRTGRKSTFWPVMNALAQTHEGKCAVAQISHARDIYPVFRSLFQKRAQI